ncbi:hypothetical protein DQ04_00741090 [Trypanosoma grayi]|uniref:hypothetical protein n=1 Tax=Trypanosoma grayi TaxID=71804 RepID=UPI0004F477BD|nr:hypothetical protein DQ04_00741090 [Trypanosoma grayi]KEG13865.1 hypothetical protein DQ04_00741090 [Trypanosoma grayi]
MASKDSPTEKGDDELPSERFLWHSRKGSIRKHQENGMDLDEATRFHLMHHAETADPGFGPFVNDTDSDLSSDE